MHRATTAARNFPAGRSQGPRRQEGVALITALLVVALASATAIAMVARQQIDLRKAANVLHFDQAYLYALGGETFASRMLVLDQVNNQKQGAVDSLDEDWAQPLPPTPVDGGQVAGYLEDLQGRFNLNHLVAALQTGQNATGSNSSAQGAAYLAYFRNLLEIAGVDNPAAVEQAVLDWMDGDIEARSPDGAEDDYYLTLDPPYRAANAPFTSPSELRLVKGITDEVYEKLAPLVTALPGPTAINVNTAPSQVLQALVQGMSESAAAKVVELRKQQRFAKTDDFKQALQKLLGSAAAVPANLGSLIDVKSSYFLLHAEVQLGDTQMHMVSVLQRGTGGGTQAQVQVLARSLGTY